MRRYLIASLCILGVFVWASFMGEAQTPRRPFANTPMVTDANGYLVITAAAQTAPVGPLTPGSNVRVRTDANGYLLVAHAGGTMSGDLTMGSGFQIFLDDGTAADPALAFTSDPDRGWYTTAGQWILADAGDNWFQFASTGLFLDENGMDLVFGESGDLRLGRDAANILAQRNGTNAQTLRLYETYTDASNNQGLAIDTGVTAANTVTLTAFENGTGSDDVTVAINAIGSAGELHFESADVIRFHDSAYNALTLNVGSGNTSNTQVLLAAPTSMSRTTTTQEAFRFSGTFNPASGTPVNQFVALEPIIDWGGTPGAGNYEALFIDVTETAIPTGTNYLIRAQVDTVDVFGVESDGDLVLTGEVSIEGSPGVDCTSAAAVTVVNGIVTACS